MNGVASGPFVERGINNLFHGTRRYSRYLWPSPSYQYKKIGAAGDINVAAVVIATIGLDVFSQMIQVSLTAAIVE